MATRPIKSISDFKGQLVGGGARPNLFEVQLQSCQRCSFSGTRPTSNAYTCNRTFTFLESFKTVLQHRF